MKNYKSGYWAVTEPQAEALVGKHFYLHDAQRGASYFGGLILDFTMTTEWEGGDGRPRAVFYFEPRREQKDFKTQEDWGFMSEKLIDDDGAHFLRRKQNPIGLFAPCDQEQWDKYKKECSSRHP